MVRTLNSNVPQGDQTQGRYQHGDIGGLGAGIGDCDDDAVADAAGGY